MSFHSRFCTKLTLYVGLGFVLLPSCFSPLFAEVTSKPSGALLPYGGFHPQASKTIFIPAHFFSGSGKGLSVITARPARSLMPWLPETAAKKLVPEPTENLGSNWRSVDVSSLKKPGFYSLGFFGSPFAFKPFSALDKTMLDKSLVQFQLDDSVFWKQLRSSLSAVTFHRSGQSMGSKASGLTVYAGHLNDAEPSPASRLLNNHLHSAINLVGGWYEGTPNDTYSKRLETQALVASQLMGLYQQNPKRFERLDIPFQPVLRGANLALPPLLREVQFGLQWINAAQTAEGSFLSRVHGLTPVDAYQPASSDTQTRYYEPPELASSLMAIGSLAKAAQVFGKQDTAYAVASLRAAEKGWHYLLLNAPPKTPSAALLAEEKTEAEPSDFPLPLSQMSQTEKEAFFFATTELWLATHKEVYSDLMADVTLSLNELFWSEQDFTPVVQQTIIACLTQAKPEDLDPQTHVSLLKHLEAKATHYMELSDANPWSLPVEREENLNLPQLVQRAQLILGYSQVNQVDNVEEAWAVYRFIMGQNPWGKAFITASNEPSASAKKTVGNKASKPLSSTELTKESASTLFQPFQPATMVYPCHPISQAASHVVGGLLLAGPGTASLWATPLPKVTDSDSLCVQNQATLQSTLALAVFAGSLNEAFNAEASELLDEGASQTKRGFRLPQLPKK